MTTLLIAIFTIGWVAAAIIGTQAYFRGEQTKPIHERNLKSESFEQLARIFTGRETNYAERIPVVALDTYNSRNLPRR
ncbi:photosystem II protein, Psb35-related [Myxosarcina sp. GI1(2024)]